LKERYIIAPKDSESMRLLDFDQIEDKDQLAVTIDEQQFIKIWYSGLFQNINIIANKCIDLFEDESILIWRS